MKAVLLAAGRGTRLKELTADKPKPMLQVGGELILERIVKGIRGAGIDSFIMITGYKAEVIENHFQDGSSLGIQVRYIRQDVPNGTAGAVVLAKDAVGDDAFLLSWGDILTPVSNYKRLVDAWNKNKDTLDGIMGVNELEDIGRGASVCFDQHTRRIESIVEKPAPGTAKSNWNQAGIFIWPHKIFDYLERVEISPRGEYEFPDAVRLWIADGGNIQALPLKGYWGDLGTPADIEDLEQKLLKNKTFLDE